MDYQLVGFVFACIGALMSVLCVGLGLWLVKVQRERHVERSELRTPDA